MKISRILSDWLPPLLWAVLIFSLSHRNSLPMMDEPIIHDKVAHALAYSILAGLLFRALDRQMMPAAAAWMAFALASAYGITDEVHQHFIPGRTSSVFDWYADVAGAALVSFAAWVASMVHQKKRGPAMIQPSW